MTRVPKQVYTVLELKGPKFQIFRAKFTNPLFRSILPKSAHFSKTFGCLAASKQALSIERELYLFKTKVVLLCTININLW